MVKRVNKTAQMEILGIAVVVVLLLVGLMFMLVFMNSSGTTSVAVDVARAQIGANTINTLMKTTTPCKKLQMSELIRDCIDTEGTNIDCFGKDSCTYVKDQIMPILRETLYDKGIEYKFVVSYQSGANFIEKFNIQTKSCVEQDHFEQIMPTQIYLGKVGLDLCR
jgi:hypothetical protein